MLLEEFSLLELFATWNLFLNILPYFILGDVFWLKLSFQSNIL